MSTCLHPEFVASVTVNRLEEVDAREGTGYMAEVTVQCGTCGVAFRFVGVAAGFDVAEPRVSVDGTTLVAPIEAVDQPKLATTLRYRMPGTLPKM
jgi:hypothetical protein